MTAPRQDLWSTSRVRLAMLAGVAGGVLCAIVAWHRPEVFWQSYLIGFLAWWLTTMGTLGLFGLGHLTGGAWMQASRPFLLAAIATTPLEALLFVPVAVDLETIFPWAARSSPVRETFSPGKAAYLAPNAFVIRASGYFVLWCAIAWMFGRRAFRRRRPGDTSGVRRAAAFALVVLLPTVTFAAFDWGMSLEPEWSSSIYGAMLAAEGVLAAHAAAIIGFGRLAKEDPAAAARLIAPSPNEQAESTHEGQSAANDRVADALQDLGSLLLTFIILAAYLAFSQFLIIWSANLSHEISWYLRRSQSGWLTLGVAAYGLHLAAPFAALLSRAVKRSPTALVRMAALTAATFFLTIHWVIAPAFPPAGVWLAAGSCGAIIAIGGLWMIVFMWQASSQLRALAADEESNVD